MKKCYEKSEVDTAGTKARSFAAAAQSVEEYHTGAWTEEETSGAKSLWHHWIAI